MLAPDDQRRHLILAEKRLELRVAPKVVGVVEEQVELDLLVARALQQQCIEGVGLRGDQGRIGHAMQVLPASAFQMQNRIANGLAVGRRRVSPVLANRRPGIAQSFEIGVAILRHEPRDPLRVRHGQAQAGGRAVVEHIHCIALEVQRIDKGAQGLRQGIEVVTVLALGRYFSEAETRQVRGDQVKVRGQQRDQVAKLMG
ncbi:hypothetical protein D3C79_763920 [compost metagenome]